MWSRYIQRFLGIAARASNAIGVQLDDGTAHLYRGTGVPGPVNQMARHHRVISSDRSCLFNHNIGASGQLADGWPLADQTALAPNVTGCRPTSRKYCFMTMREMSDGETYCSRNVVVIDKFGGQTPQSRR